jgi:hypothetical protein
LGAPELQAKSRRPERRSPWPYRNSKIAINHGEKNDDPPPITTTSGAPPSDNQNSLAAGSHGGIRLQDYQLIEKLAPSGYLSAGGEISLIA